MLALVGDPNSIIVDIQKDPFAPALQFNRSLVRMAVTGNVAQGFLGHAIKAK